MRATTWLPNLHFNLVLLLLDDVTQTSIHNAARPWDPLRDAEQSQASEGHSPRTV